MSLGGTASSTSGGNTLCGFLGAGPCVPAVPDPSTPAPPHADPNVNPPPPPDPDTPTPPAYFNPGRYIASGTEPTDERVVVKKIAYDDTLGGLNSMPGATVNYTTGEVYLDPEDSFRASDYQLERTMGGETSFDDTPVAQTSQAGTWVVNTFGDQWGDGAQIVARYTPDGASSTTHSEQHAIPRFNLNVRQGYSDDIVPGSVRLVRTRADLNPPQTRYIDRNGIMFRIDSGIGVGQATQVGTIDYSTGDVWLDASEDAERVTGWSVSAVAVARGQPYTSEVFFRTAGAPLRPGGLGLVATTLAGEELIGSTDFDGNITGTKMRGFIDWVSGSARVEFGEVVGGVWVPEPVIFGSIRYNAVIYTFIPLDPELLGLDPARLPINGRVPIFRPGDVAVLHNSQTFDMPSPLAAEQVVNLGRTDLEAVQVFDATGARVDAAQYTVDLAAGTVTMAAAPDFDLSGYTEPLQTQHRIAQMFLVSDAQIGGKISLGSQIARDYPLDDTYLSSALPFGDLQARVQHFFSQETWTGEWSDTRIGDNTTAQYNDVDFPVEVTNETAIDQRWAIIFTGSSTFNVVGETVGQIATGSTSLDLSPVNALTGGNYFILRAAGWGSGWSVGDVVRFNTVGANAPMWVIRTTLQGPPEEPDDQVVIEVRGDADE